MDLRMNGSQIRSPRDRRKPSSALAVVALSFCLLGSLGCRSGGSWGFWNTPPEDSTMTASGSDATTERSATSDLPRTTISLAGVRAESVPSSEETRNPKSEIRKGTDSPALPPPCTDYPLDLETALGLAGAQNPTIALAGEAVRASQADLLQAWALLLPTLEAGVSFNLHRGNLESARGIIREVNRQSLYAGAGASAVGAGTVTIPGVLVTGHVADAIFDPHIAGQKVTGRVFDSAATRNRVFLEVTTRYFALAGAEARLQALRQSESDLAEVVQLTANFARTGQGRHGDAERAQSEAFLLHVTAEQAEEEVAVAAAELARLLSLDPAVHLRAPSGPLPVIQLVDPHAELEALIQLALQNRPEVGARMAEVTAKETQLRKERVRPFVPLLSVGYSAGGFGGGSNLADSRFGHFSSRTDFDVYAVWSLQNFGLGNLAVQRQVRAQVGEAVAEQVRVVDLIRREVAEAYALSAARRRELEVAGTRVATAQRAYRLDLIRAKNLEGRPIELLHSLNLLATARQDLVRAQVGYIQAQFQLFVALGQPPTAAQVECSAQTAPSVPTVALRLGDRESS
jgi:outer membrane protein TolC